MLKKLLSYKNLSEKESYMLFSDFQNYTLSQQAAILGMLRTKQETVEEILGALHYFKSFSNQISHNLDVIDIVGTGGDTANTFNISTAASILTASCGALVAKHGGKSMTSQSGSQDIVEILAINTPKKTEEVLTALSHYSYAYLGVSLFNTMLKEYTSLRRELKFPTIFNILGPLLNPMNPKKQVIGVYRRDLLEKIAQILLLQGIQHALIVHSEDGLDEISISSTTHIIEIKNGLIKKFILAPELFGISRVNLSDIKGGNSKKNADIICKIFSGEIKDAKRDALVLNAAAGLYVSGKASSIAEGVQTANEAIDTGKAIKLIEEMRGAR